MRNRIRILSWLFVVLAFPPVKAADVYHAQGELAGEPGVDSALLQSRLTAVKSMDENRAVPGALGVARFVIDQGPGSADAMVTPWLTAESKSDYIVRYFLRGLQPNRRYRYHLEFGANETTTKKGPFRWFRTLPDPASHARLSFLMFNCMSWDAFMDGYSNRLPYAGPDKALGYPTLATMKRYSDSHFVIGAGDLVYYDVPSSSKATTLEELRTKWRRQFSLPRAIDFFGTIGAYWMKDDHDFRYDDADLTGLRGPSPELGIRVFKEQMPVVPHEDFNRPTYRTVRASANVQLWFVEGRDYRSPKAMPDGPDKSIWGMKQREWLKKTLRESNATWKLLITEISHEGRGRRIPARGGRVGRKSQG